MLESFCESDDIFEDEISELALKTLINYARSLARANLENDNYLACEEFLRIARMLEDQITK
jgi:hypothetical protein